MDVAAVADELYGLPLDEFTAARNAYVKHARQSGEKDVAATIAALGKPSAAAGLANQLVRQHGAELAPLLELGASLRAATAALSGAELRTLGQQQHRLISALVGQARSLAADDGRTVNADQARGLEETLHAALADEGAAAQLMTGRLTEALHRSGLGSGGMGSGGMGSGGMGSSGMGSDGTGSGGMSTAPTKSARSARTSGKAGHRTSGGGAERGEKVGAGTAADRERSQRERAERAARAERDKAATEVEQARAALDHAEADADQADAQWDEAKSTVLRLREELDRATAEQSETDRSRRRLRTKAEQARRAERAAQHRLDALT